MTTIVCPPAPVVPLPTGRGDHPAPVRVCHYCVETFQPTRDRQDGSLWDIDDSGQHCCNDCHCPTCLIGHHPDQTCPATLEPAGRAIDDDIVAREETAVYGDPDARYDALTDALAEACSGDTE